MDSKYTVASDPHSHDYLFAVVILASFVMLRWLWAVYRRHFPHRDQICCKLWPRSRLLNSDPTKFRATVGPTSRLITRLFAFRYAFDLRNDDALYAKIVTFENF